MLGLYTRQLARQGWQILAPRRVGQETPLFVFREAHGTRVFDLFADESAFTQYAKSRQVSKVIINHLIDLPEDIIGWIHRFVGQIGAEYELLLHDYYLACPRVDLVDRDGIYCGLAPESRCKVCLRDSGEILSRLDPVAWRASSALLLASAARSVGPSEDHARRLRRVFPNAQIEVWPPEDDSEAPARGSPPTLAAGSDMRVLLLGALNHSKGQSVIVSLARELNLRHAPLRLTLLGPAADARRLRRVGVRVLGRYRSEDVQDLIQAEQPHVIFFPAIWPETWSFVLTEALRSSAQIVAFDHGAIGERLSHLGRGRLIPYALHADAAALADALLQLRCEFDSGCG